MEEIKVVDTARAVVTVEVAVVAVPWDKIDHICSVVEDPMVVDMVLKVDIDANHQITP